MSLSPIEGVDRPIRTCRFTRSGRGILLEFGFEDVKGNSDWVARQVRSCWDFVSDPKSKGFSGVVGPEIMLDVKILNSQHVIHPQMVRHFLKLSLHFPHIFLFQKKRTAERLEKVGTFWKIVFFAGRDGCSWFWSQQRPGGSNKLDFE